MGVSPWLRAPLPCSPAGDGRALPCRGLTRESRRRQRLPARPGPQSRGAAHSPAGSRWPTRAAGDTEAQTPCHGPPSTPSLGTCSLQDAPPGRTGTFAPNQADKQFCHLPGDPRSRAAVLRRAVRMGGNSLERPPGWGGEGLQIPEGRGDWMAGGEWQQEDLDIKGLVTVAKMAPTLQDSPQPILYKMWFCIKRRSVPRLENGWPHGLCCSTQCWRNDSLAILNLGLRRPCSFHSFSLMLSHHVNKPAGG